MLKLVLSMRQNSLVLLFALLFVSLCAAKVINIDSGALPTLCDRSTSSSAPRTCRSLHAALELCIENGDSVYLLGDVALAAPLAFFYGQNRLIASLNGNGHTVYCDEDFDASNMTYAAALQFNNVKPTHASYNPLLQLSIRDIRIENCPVRSFSAVQIANVSLRDVHFKNGSSSNLFTFL